MSSKSNPFIIGLIIIVLLIVSLNLVGYLFIFYSENQPTPKGYHFSIQRNTHNINESFYLNYIEKYNFQNITNSANNISVSSNMVDVTTFSASDIGKLQSWGQYWGSKGSVNINYTANVYLDNTTIDKTDNRLSIHIPESESIINVWSYSTHMNSTNSFVQVQSFNGVTISNYDAIVVQHLSIGTNFGPGTSRMFELNQVTFLQSDLSIILFSNDFHSSSA